MIYRNYKYELAAAGSGPRFPRLLWLLLRPARFPNRLGAGRRRLRAIVSIALQPCMDLGWPAPFGPSPEPLSQAVNKELKFRT
jgi:hypothetical protein